MEDKEIQMAHLDTIHTTALGEERIKKNISLADDDVVKWCKQRRWHLGAKLTVLAIGFSEKISFSPASDMAVLCMQKI